MTRLAAPAPDASWYRSAPIRAGARFGRLKIVDVEAGQVSLVCDCGERVQSLPTALSRGALLQCWKCDRALQAQALAVFRAECALAFAERRKPRGLGEAGDDFAQIAGVVFTGAELAELLDVSGQKLRERSAARGVAPRHMDHRALMRTAMRLRRAENVAAGRCGCGGKRQRGEERCGKCIARHDERNGRAKEERQAAKRGASQ